MTDRITRVSLQAKIGAFVGDVRTGRREVTGLRQDAERFSKGRYEASVRADTKPARAELSALEKRLKAFASTPVDDKRINLDTDEARDRLRALQARLTEFGTTVSDARVSVDDAQARSKISRIEASLLALGSRTAEADIDLEGIAAAEAQLGTLESQLSRYDGSDYRASVHLDGTLAATRQASALIDTLAMLGPTVVPLAAAATPVLAGLTAGLGAAAVGGGVAALAFSGVGDAVEAMGEKQRAAAGNARTSARAQVMAAQQVTDARRGVADAERAAAESAQDSARRIADARRSVRDAERDAAQAAREGAREIRAAQERVVDARRQAAEAAREAAQQVEDAEEALADSHQRVEDALADLHAARQQAIADLRELREETQDNALDVEAAEIGLLEARQRLTEATADSESTELDLRKARLSVAQAEDRLSDARAQAQADQEKLSKAERDGISNAAGVVAARRDVAEAHEGVRDAQEAVAEAQRDAAQVQAESADRIADAVEGVARARQDAAQRNAEAQRQIADAQRGLVQASIDAAQSRAASARRIQDAERALQRAMAATRFEMGEQSTEAEKLAEKMQALGPAGRDFVRFLHDLRPEMQRLQDIAQEGLLPGVEDGIRGWLDLMPRWESLTRNVATALGVLAREGGEALNDPFWREFFAYIDREADDILLDFGRSLGNITAGFAGMMMALDPLTDDFREGFLGMSEDFEHWGKTLDDNESFERFAEYAQRVGPEVWKTLGEVAEALLAIAEAAAPVGEASLPIIRTLANIIEAVAESPAGPVLVGVAAGLGAISRMIRIYDATKHSRIVGLIGSMGTKADGSRGKLKRLSGFLAVGGPWGIALGVAAFAVGKFMESQAEAQAQADALRESLDKQTGAITRNSIRLIVNEARKEGLYEAGKKLGISEQELTLALSGNAEALKRVGARLDQAQRASRDAATSSDKYGMTTAETSETVGKLTSAVYGQNKELAEQRRKLEESRDAADLVGRVMNELNGETRSAASAAKILGRDTDLSRRDLLKLAEQMGLNRKATKELIDKYREVPEDINTDARFNDKDARERTREFKKFLNEQLADIRDEEVRIRVAVSENQQRKSDRMMGIGGRGQLPAGRLQMHGGASSLPAAAGGAAQIIARSSGDRAGARQVAASVSDRVNARAGDIRKAMREEMARSLGPPGRAGRVLPAGSYRIGMPYMGYPGHYGADYPAPTGTPVYSPYSGRVTAAYDLPGSNPYNNTPYRSYGRLVKVAYDNGAAGLFAHLSSRIDRLGRIDAGTMIGRVGMNGNATGPHLHYEHRRNGSTVNPATTSLFDRGGRWRSGTGGMNLSGKDELVLPHDLASRIFPDFARGGDVVSQPQVVYAAPSAGTASGPSLERLAGLLRRTSGVELSGPVHLHDATDIDMLVNRLGFALSSGVLGAV